MSNWAVRKDQVTVMPGTTCPPLSAAGCAVLCTSTPWVPLVDAATTSSCSGASTDSGPIEMLPPTHPLVCVEQAVQSPVWLLWWGGLRWGGFLGGQDLCSNQWSTMVNNGRGVGHLAVGHLALGVGYLALVLLPFEFLELFAVLLLLIVIVCRLCSRLCSSCSRQW